MWNFSALHATLCWGPVQARTAVGNICAHTHQLLLAYMDAAGRSHGEEEELMGNTWPVSWVAKYLVAALTWGQSVRRGLIQRAFFWCAQRQEQTIQATLHSVPPRNPAHDALYREGCAALWKPPFPRWAGGTPSAHCSNLSLLRLPLLPACLISSSARIVSGLFSLFKYKQDVFLVVVL